MAEKTLNTRMQQKHDVEANWKKATGFVPKAGEIIIYDKDTIYSYQRIKIGDGTRTVTALPFVTTSVNGSTGDVRITASDIGAADANEVEDLKEEVALASAYALKTLINGGDYNNLLNRPCYEEITSASYTIKNDPIVGMPSMFEGAPTPLRQIPDIPSSILSQPLSMTVLMNDNGEVVEIPLTTEVVNAGEEVPGAEVYLHISSMLDDVPFIFIKTTGPMPELSIPHAGTFYIDTLFSYISSMSPTADLSLTINFPNEITIPGKQLDDVLIPDNIARLDDIPVQSVNGKTGAVVINAADVGALPDTTKIPSIEGLATETYVDEAVAANKALLVNCTLTEDGQGFVSDKEITDIVNAATNGQIVQACIQDLGIMIPLAFLSSQAVIFTAAIDSGEGAPGVIALSMLPDGNKFSSVQLATYNPEEKDYGKNLLVVTYEKIGNSESLTADANQIYAEYIAGRNVVLLISNGILYHAEYIGSDECRFVHYEFNADGSGTRIVATMTGSRMPVFVTENIAASRSNPNALTINGTSYDGSAKVDITLNASDVGALPDTTVIPSVEGLASEEFVNNAITDINYPVDSVNGKTGAVSLTASDIGALPNTTAIPSIEGLATEIYVNEQVAALVDSSPDTLNTLNELAAALGDDPNFATTIATEIGKKVDKTTTVNGKALSNNITLSASDVGALPDTTEIPSIEGLATESKLVNGQYITFRASGTGTAYSATIEGITTLNTGTILVMIPDTTSTNRAGVTLNINGLGAKNLYRRNAEGSLVYGTANNWLKAGTPYIILYCGSYWEVANNPAFAASDLSGNVPISKGGTGATDAATARSNLGITPANIGAATTTDITNALSPYAKKTELPSIEGLATETYVNNTISAINYPVTSVNGKTGVVNLAASDVNAEKAGAVAAAIDALRIKNGNNSSIRSAQSAEDDSEYSIGYHAIALGDNSKASGSMSYAEGYGTTASGGQSHAEGQITTASGGSSHSEGYNTTASGVASHAEGMDTTASGNDSHAEGYNTTASGDASHAEGQNTTASGEESHAEGLGTTASGNRSHAEGRNTIASSDNQHVQGKYNLEDTANKYAHIVGNGMAVGAYSNAHTLDWDGLGWFAGGLKVGGTGQDDENAVSVLTENDLTAITESEIDAICGQTI